MGTIIRFPLEQRIGVVADEEEMGKVIPFERPYQPIIEVLEKSHWPPKDMLAPEEAT